MDQPGVALRGVLHPGARHGQRRVGRSATADDIARNRCHAHRFPERIWFITNAGE
jgi:hypothetical protein